MSRIDEFGKDLGLVHELVVTGRKAKMTQEAYACLAHNETFFSQMAAIIRHKAVLEKIGIEATLVNKELAELLIEDVNEIKSGCIFCHRGQKREAWPLYLCYAFNENYYKPPYNDGYNDVEDWMRAINRYDVNCKKRDKLSKDSNEYKLLNQQVENFRVRLTWGLRIMLTVRLKEMGLHPGEFAEFSRAFNWESGRDFLQFEHGCYDYDTDFIPVLRQLIKQREILSILK